MHWGLTLLIAPFSSQAIEYVFIPNKHKIVGLLEVYPITLIFSLVFSLPTLLIYLISFYYLSKNNINPTVSKYLLIVIAATGVYVTMSIIGGSMSHEISIAYASTAVVVGMLLKLKRKEKETNYEPINT